MEAEQAAQVQRAKQRRFKFWAIAGLALVLLAADLARPPARQVSAAALLLAIDAYQATLSKALKGSGAQCRFSPSCSRYGEQAIRRHGALLGSARAAWRVLRCGPWTAPNTLDLP